MRYDFSSVVWEYGGKDTWFFVTLPEEVSKEIKELFISQSKSFGSIKIRAYIGKTVWETSIFPNNQSGVYDLPIKKSVRKAESIIEGTKVAVKVEILL